MAYKLHLNQAVKKKKKRVLEEREGDQVTPKNNTTIQERQECTGESTHAPRLRSERWGLMPGGWAWFPGRSVVATLPAGGAAASGTAAAEHMLKAPFPHERPNVRLL